MTTEVVEDDIMLDKELKEAINEMKKQSPSRKFVESVDLAINLRDINLQDPSKRFQLEVVLLACPRIIGFGEGGLEVETEDLRSVGLCLEATRDFILRIVSE